MDKYVVAIMIAFAIIIPLSVARLVVKGNAWADCRQTHSVGYCVLAVF